MEKRDVALVGCRGYERGEVADSVARVFELLGGPGAACGKGRSVFVKVNGLIAAPPEEGVTTHPEVVRAVVEELKKVTDRITIGDSPGGPYNQSMLRRVYRASGYDRVAEETGAALNFDTGVKRVAVGGGRAVKSVTLCSAMAEADRIVSISKMKTHMFMNITCAIKNMFGAVPGMNKVSYHSSFSRENDFADLIVDVLLASGASFHVVDAVQGMDGDGPRKGDIKMFNLLAAGADAFAVDAAMMRVIGIEPRFNKPLAAAIERGLFAETDLRLLGDPLESLAVEGFRLPLKKDMAARIPSSVMDRFGNLLAVRPRPTESCTACRKCVDVCPAKAITIEGKVARVDLDRCIRCYCCHELCEHDAIELVRPLLLRAVTMLDRGSGQGVGA